MWGEALLTVVYLTNRSPTDSSKLTLYEMWEDKKPNLKNLQIFGCKAYVKILNEEKKNEEISLKKLNERSEKCIFIGYALTGYKLWDKENWKIKIARDVKFKEETQDEVKKQEKEIQQIYFKYMKTKKKRIKFMQEKMKKKIMNYTEYE